jgi:class 3 adenylate cyclase
VTPDTEGQPAPTPRTFLIADIRGFTRFTQTYGDEAAGLLATRFAELAAEAVNSHAGELIELRGDEALCVFGSARQAIRAATALQRLLRAPELGRETFPNGVGIGIDAGEAVPISGGYRGAALNTAARLCSAAKPGQVLITATVERLAGPVAGVTYVAQRPLAAKGIDRPVRAFEVVPDEPLPSPPPLETGSRRGARRRRMALLAAAVAVILVIGGAALVGWGGSTTRGAASVVARPDSVAVIDPTANRVVADVHVGIDGYPPNIAAGPEGVWTYGTTSNNLFRIDPATLKVTPLGVGVTPTNIALGFGRVWVAAGWDKKLVSLDAQSPDLTSTLRLPSGSPSTSLAIGQHQLWVALASCVCDSLLAVNTAGSKVIARPNVIATSVAAEGSALWVEQYLHPTSIAEVQPVPDKTVVGTEESFPPPGYLALGFGYAWYAAGIHLWKFTRAPIGTNDTIRLPNTARAITIAAGEVWVATDSMIVGVDPQSDTIEHRIPLANQPSGIAYYNHRLWVPIPP